MDSFQERTLAGDRSASADQPLHSGVKHALRKMSSCSSRHFKSMIYISNNRGDAVRYSGMFTNVKPASVQLRVSGLRGDVEGNHPPPFNAQSRASCCPLRRHAGRGAAPVNSAVQRSFLDGFGHGGAKESDDGPRVLAADHSAARHDHVGPGLTGEGGGLSDRKAA